MTCNHIKVHIIRFLNHLALSKKEYTALTRQDIEGYLLCRPWSVHTRKDVLFNIKRFYEYLKENHIVEDNPAEAIVIRARKAVTLIRVPPMDAIRKILQRMEKDASDIGLRDRLMVEFAYGSGMRRNEIATLNIEDIDLKNGTARVLGKGHKERVVPLTGRSMKAFVEYVGRMREQRKFVFLSHQNTRVCSAVIGNNIKQKTGINAHLLRHACATHMLLNGCGIRYIQELLGHSRINTTQIYTNLDRENLRQLVNEKHPARNRSAGFEYAVDGAKALQ
jgi:site-specific recombinase XerD